MTGPAPCDVAVIGEIYVDHVFTGFETWPAPGEEVVTDDYAREIGGGAAATACGLARLGRSVELIGIVGDADATWFERRLAEFGVGFGGLHRSPGQSGVTVSVSTARDRSFFTHVGVNRRLDALLAGPEILARVSAARHVHFAMPLSPAAAAALLPRLESRGCTTSLDMGWQPAWFADADNLATLRRVDHLLPNQLEAARLAGGDGVEAYFGFADRLPLKQPVLKLGAEGAVARDATRGGLVHVLPPAVAVVDTTGAGDAFDAGFIDALLDGAGVEARLRRACITGALSTRAAGALAALPDRKELKATYEQVYG